MNTNEIREEALLPEKEDWKSRNHIRSFIQLGITILGVFLCYLMTVPFLSSLAWALALAVLFMPVHKRIFKKLKKKNMAALVTSALAIIIVVIPVMWMVIRLVLEIDKGAALIMDRVSSGEWQNNLESMPLVGRAVFWLENHLNIPQAVNNLTSWLTAQVTLFLRSSFIQIIVIVLTFYLLFYFLRDRNEILRTVRRFSPLCGRETNGLFKVVNNTIRATVFGTLAVSAIKGFLAGFMFWVLGAAGATVVGIDYGNSVDHSPSGLLHHLDTGSGLSGSGWILGSGFRSGYLGNCGGRSGKQRTLSHSGQQKTQITYDCCVHRAGRRHSCLWCLRSHSGAYYTDGQRFPASSVAPQGHRIQKEHLFTNRFR